MALKFWTGGARSDKSSKLLNYILKEAKDNPNVDYLVVVPEQFGLSTQREYVMASENKGILNIDVLSFMRLAHRISDEVGSFDSTVTTLDDMGKSLILQLLTSDNKGNLPAFSANINKLGTVSKIKSMISEFMQYGIDPDKVDKMAETAMMKGKGQLAGKLSDVGFLYRSFLDFINEKYTTTEETLSRVSSIIHKSETVNNSVIVFDGFTGFTPVQLKLLGTLMEYARDIHIALMYEEGGDVFDLSKKTMDCLEKMAEERRVIVSDPYKGTSIMKDPVKSLMAGANPEEEIRLVAGKIRKLVIEKGYRYKDIAIVTGNLEGYRGVIRRVLARENIPCFIDKTQPMLLNPFVEYIRSLIDIYADNYSYEAMFRFLKSGLCDISRQEVDLLENFCLKKGIKGNKRWHTNFYIEGGDGPKNDRANKNSKDIDDVIAIEETRKKIIARLDRFYEELGCSDKGLLANTQKTVREFTVALYRMIEAENIEEKLKLMADDFQAKGQEDLASEYGQVYVKIMKLLEEIVALVSDEKVDIRSFGQLVGAGLDSLRIGMVPKGSDYVQVGDLTRSRLGDIRTLFIVGANEGVIPSAGKQSGVINDADREFLSENLEGLIIAPSTREDAFNQRLYLYMAMNKPKEELILSYAKVMDDGKAALPSYIVRKIKREEGLKIEMLPENVLERIDSRDTAFTEFSYLCPKFFTGQLMENEEVLCKELIEYFSTKEEYKDRLKNVIYNALPPQVISDDNTIGKVVANALYGKKLTSSITKLETYANCAYQYFLRYGLGLRERDVFSFEARDLGNIFHDSLAEYSRLIEKKGYSWENVPESVVVELMDQAVGSAIAKEKDSAIYSTARTSYMVNRIKRIMNKTAMVLTSQVQKGEFRPKYFELDFRHMDSDDSISFNLSEEEELRLLGRIDRVDVCDVDDSVYVKVIDYKSSGKSLDLAAIYEGRQLQLLVYLNAAMENEHNKTGKEALAGAVLYYHIDDPVIEADGSDLSEAVHEKVLNKLKLTGFVNGDRQAKAVSLIDKDFVETGSSTVINAKRNKDGSISKNSKDIISGEELEILGKYVSCKITEIGKSILDGNIAVPIVDNVERFTEANCTYCDYKGICGNRKGSSGLEEELYGEAYYEDQDDGYSADSSNGSVNSAKVAEGDFISLMKLRNLE